MQALRLFLVQCNLPFPHIPQAIFYFGKKCAMAWRCHLDDDNDENDDDVDDGDKNKTATTTNRQ